MRKLLLLLVLLSGASFAQTITDATLETDQTISGVKTFTNRIIESITGTYTNAAMSFGITSQVGTTAPETIWHSSQGAGNYSSDAITGVVTVPVGGTAYQADGVAGYAVDNSGASNAVALYGYAQCNVPNGKCWGANPAALAAAGATGVTVQAIEADANVQTGATAAIVWGLNVQAPIWNETPALSAGVNVGPPGGTAAAKWGSALLTQAGATLVGVHLAPVATGATQSSQSIQLHGRTSGDADVFGTINSDAVGAIALTPGGSGNVSILSGNLAVGSSSPVFFANNGTGSVRIIPTTGQSILFQPNGTTQSSIDSSGKGTFNGGLDANSAGIANAGAVSATAVTATSLKTTNLLISSTAPTISSGFGTGAAVSANNGIAAFTIGVGTGGSATNGVIGLPTATTGWNCFTNNLTAAAGHRADNTVQTASSTTTATIENQTKSTGAAIAWTASDVVRVSCFAY